MVNLIVLISRDLHQLRVLGAPGAQGLSRRELLALVLHFCRLKAEQVPENKTRELESIFSGFSGDLMDINGY